MKYDDLDHSQKLCIITKALNWYKLHKNHVNELIKGDVRFHKKNMLYCPPSGNDIFRPELWKSGHWLWLNSQITIDTTGGKGDL